jgi:hypothetical protein
MIDLERAREFGALVRLVEDTVDTKFDSLGFEGRESHRDTMLRHGVLLSKAVTPLLDSRLSKVCRSLGIPRSNVSAFVYNSSDVQADCLIDTSDTCVLRFTSSLINLMNDKEFQFVAGHELGHFLLGHGACAQHLPQGSTEDYLVKRARELSADRIGFLSIESMEDAIRAIIKTASGLGDQFLRFDVASFLSQADMVSEVSKGESANSTHPSMLFRCRALLWFSMSIKSISDVTDENITKIRQVDSRVIRDLKRFVDGQIRIRKVEIEAEVALWKSVMLVFHTGSFSKDVQSRFSLVMGEEVLASVKSFLELYSQDKILEQISRRLDKALSSASAEFPFSAKEMENAAFQKAYQIVDG